MKMITSFAFTYLEMLIVFLIISIFLSFSVPFLNEIRQEEQAALFKLQLIDLIEYTRDQSQVNHLPLSLCPSVDKKQCSKDWTHSILSFIDAKEKGKVDSTSHIITMLQIPNGDLYWRSFPRYFPYLIFLPVGMMHNNNGTFWFCQKRARLPSWALMLSRSGHLRVLDHHHGPILDAQGKQLTCDANK